MTTDHLMMGVESTPETLHKSNYPRQWTVSDMLFLCGWIILKLIVDIICKYVI